MQFYRQTLKKAWNLAIRNPYLWFFGLFAALAGNGEEYDTFINNIKSVSNAQVNLDTLRTAFLDGRITQFFRNLEATFGSSFWTITLLILVALVILLLLAWLVTVSQAAIIRSASRREDGEPIGVLDAFTGASRCFKPLLGLNILALAIIYIPLGLLALPLIALYIPNASVASATAITILAFFILVPINVVTSFITKYAAAYIVIRGSKIFPAIRDAWALFRKNWMITFELGLFLMIINVVYSVAVISILTLLGLPFSRYGLITFTAIIIVLGSIYAVFRYSAWALLFRALIEDRVVSKLVRIFQPKIVGE